jgi:hypothetical protein
VFCVAVAGSTTTRTAGLRTATTTGRRTGTTTSVSGWYYPFSSKEGRMAVFEQKMILFPQGTNSSANKAVSK